MKKYLVGSFGRGKQFYFDTLDEAIEKANKLNKNRQSKKLIIEGVVENGTGVAAQVSGVSVAGKTGTAERVDGDDDSWFVGIAPSDSDGKKIVVALVLENGGSGTAAARAKNVLATALDTVGLR